MRNILIKTSCVLSILISSRVCAADTKQLISASDRDLVNAERSVMESLVLEAQPLQATKKKIPAKKALDSKEQIVKIEGTKKQEKELAVKPISEKKIETKVVEKKQEIAKPVIQAKKIDAVRRIRAAPVNIEVKRANIELARPNIELARSNIELTRSNIELTQLRTDNASLKSELEATKAKIKDLNQEVDSARSELVVAETEMNRLLALTPLKASKRIAMVPEVRNDDRAMIIPSRNNTTKIQAPESAMPERGAPYPVATVSMASAELRLGPGASYAVLTRLPEGSRVAVEMRKGEWYRVFSPAGERAWIHSGAVIFGDKVSPMNDSSAARVQGYKSSAEDRAFRELVGR